MIDFYNGRYRLIVNRDKYYLADLEWNVLIFLFPFFYWILPARLYTITEEEYKKIELDEETKRFKAIMEKEEGWPHLLGAGIGAVILTTSMGFIEQFYVSFSQEVKMYMIIGLLLLSLSLRLHMSLRRGRKMGQELDVKRYKKVKISPEKKKVTRDISIAYTLSVGMTSLFAYMFIQEGTIFSAFSFCLFLAFVVFCQSGLFFDNKEQYKISYVN